MNATVQEREAVRLALYQFSQRAKDIMDRLPDRTDIVPFEKMKLRALYTALKEDLKDAADRGTVAPGWDKQSQLEKDYFQPAVVDALKLLRARANTNPITSNWLDCISSSRQIIIAYMDNLERLGS